MTENLYTPDSIRTVSGRYINMVMLDPETLHIEDIAHALGNVPRFGGHLPIFYSVAQHSLLVHDLVKDLEKPVRLQALMHDASEALLGDMPSPIKAMLPDYQALEARVMLVMSERFEFDWPLCPEVKAADKQMLEIEWRELMLNEIGRTTYMTDMYASKTFVELYRELKA